MHKTLDILKNTIIEWLIVVIIVTVFLVILLPMLHYIGHVNLPWLNFSKVFKSLVGSFMFFLIINMFNSSNKKK